MPESARVGSIVIRIYADDTRKHRRPHFHAVGPDAGAVISLPEMEIIAGRLARSGLEAVLDFAEQHREHLIREWNRLIPTVQIVLPEEP